MHASMCVGGRGAGMALLLLLLLGQLGCAEFATLQHVQQLESRLAEVETEAAMALANASCRPEVVELMKEVAKVCDKKLSCTDSLILSAISEADPEDRFLTLMKSQRSAAFYFPDPWSNSIHSDRLNKLISRRQLPRTKFLIVANSTPRKAKPQSQPQNDDPDVAVSQAQDRAINVVNKLRERARVLSSEPGRAVLPVSEDDLRVWVVPYLVKQADLTSSQLPQDGVPPIGYADLIDPKLKQTPQQQQQRFLKAQQAIMQSVWVFLIDCWPSEKKKADTAESQFPSPKNDGVSEQNLSKPAF